MDEITSEAIGVLRSGADMVCDQAIRKWRSDSYEMGHEHNYHQVQRWEKIRRKSQELVRTIKEIEKGGSK